MPRPTAFGWAVAVLLIVGLVALGVIVPWATRELREFLDVLA